MKEMMVVGSACRSCGGDSHIDVWMEFCCLVLVNVQIWVSSRVFVLQDVRHGSSLAGMTESRSIPKSSCEMSPTECCHTGFSHGCRHSPVAHVCNRCDDGREARLSVRIRRRLHFLSQWVWCSYVICHI